METSLKPLLQGQTTTWPAKRAAKATAARRQTKPWPARPAKQEQPQLQPTEKQAGR